MSCASIFHFSGAYILALLGRDSDIGLLNLWSPYLPRAGHQGVIVDGFFCLGGWSALEDHPPPEGRIKGPGTVVQRRIDIREEVPHMANYHTHDLVPRNCPIHDQAEAHEDPRKVRRSEHQEAKETKSRIWVPSGPNVHEC